MRESGGLDAILWAVKNFPEHSELHAYGCGALGNLFIDNRKNAEYAVDEKGATELIVSAPTPILCKQRFENLDALG